MEPRSIDDLIGVPVRLEGGGVGRLAEVEGGVVSELWNPEARSWERGKVDLSAVWPRPVASPEDLDRVGAPFV